MGIINSGNYNNGDFNSGDRNSGWFNSGSYNSGYRNSGCYNSGDRNSGWFNTDEPKMRFFNKISDYTYTEFRKKFGFKEMTLSLTRWVDSEKMTDEEKENIKDWSEMGGYLKTFSYKEAWRIAWDEASEEQKDWYKNLPNFDSEIFKEITGVKINEPNLSGKKVKVEFHGKSYTATHRLNN